MNNYFTVALIAFYPAFGFYYALNRYTALGRNSASWELMEIFLSYWGVPYALFLTALFIPWAKLTKKALNRRYSKASSLFSGMFFGILLSLFLAVFATRVKKFETSILFYLPLATYGAIFGICAFIKETRVGERSDSKEDAI